MKIVIICNIVIAAIALGMSISNLIHSYRKYRILNELIDLERKQIEKMRIEQNVNQELEPGGYAMNGEGLSLEFTLTKEQKDAIEKQLNEYCNNQTTEP